MKFVVTGATGFLGSRAAALLAERGHDVLRVARPGRTAHVAFAEPELVRMDAGDTRLRGLLAGCDAVLHFAGVPDPGRARSDPARAVRENAGTTLNLLEGCAEHGAALVYPSTVRAGVDPPPDEYALSKRLGEDVCRLHRGRATVLRLTSVFGPGQVAERGATGAIAVFAARALDGRPIVIPGNPARTRDFLYVDDVVLALEAIAAERRWDETLTLASGVSTSLLDAANLVRRAARSTSPVETPGGVLPRGEDESYEAPTGEARLAFGVRPLEDAVRLYVDWLRRYRDAPEEDAARAD